MEYLKRIKLLIISGLAICLLSTGHISAGDKKPVETFGIVIHGGAGSITKKTMDVKNDKLYREKLTEALSAGYRVLENNGSSIEAVETAIKVMEDSPLFNSGKGAVFTDEGTNELDASIMDGETLNAGAVAGVRRIKNPISLARLVMEKSPHVLLVGEGAEAFARQEGMDWVSPDYFFTKKRWKALQKIKAKEKKENKKTSPGENALDKDRNEETEKFGTVGAVALDKKGNLAAGTSTGGMMNKKFGRVGDSPVIGAGTYANNKTCALSATGHGEFFIRSVAAYDISALMEYKGLDVKAASELVVEKLKKLGGIGGFIAIDGRGNIAMPFSSAGMFRGYALKDQEITVKMYKE
jgi:beta-aspartyl-peptidase (threonine type)